MPISVGEGFYRFANEFLGQGWELERRWVTEVTSRGYRHGGGAVESPEDGHGYPWRCAATKEEAFRIGKQTTLAEMAKEEAALRAGFHRQLQELRERRKRLRALTLGKIRVRGGNDSYETFKRNWDIDF